ncbi:hypothetical protein [Erythrobacter rubeus]|uniref:Uncharacterized protein n=1 Tax=Erythrobacter rubeus TaxID=2760803 RepID=A0ABR8KW40_9SPHN|nr:hypothetical protein [Erythrobacter rubeus]MBD2842426.1 hypothetical protein [Erythrobacter rubeus]
MAKWYKFPTSSAMSEGDYRAGLSAMNIVFGAVLGFVLVGGQELPVTDFMAMLSISALIVMMIQAIALSEYTLFNVASTAAAIYFLPEVAEEFFSIAKVPKLQPTLAVWATMAVILELSPREKTDPETTKKITGETNP